MAHSTHRAFTQVRSFPRHDMNEQEMHSAAIQEIAEDTGRPVMEVAALYEQTLDTMTRTAAVPDFLMVLVAKKVRDRYRTRR